MLQREIDSGLRRELASVAEQAGCELLDATFKGRILRLVLDRAEGVTLGDCETVSKQVSALLDTIDFGPGKYVLEVSSPGLDRKLYGPRDYQRFSGRTVRVTWRPPGEAKRTLVGRLEGFRSDCGGRVTIVDPTTKQCHRIGLDEIEVARLEIEL